MSLAALGADLGADHRARPWVDEVGAFARGAGYCV
ncbi:hypothetical protein GGD63_005847 [Bradyrhizobium sp. cir1]|nr:hypothetical protein [Bradyrhizobium sp. cir1]